MFFNVFGYGVVAQGFVRFLNSQGFKARIFDDKFTSFKGDEFGNLLYPSHSFVDYSFFDSQSLDSENLEISESKAQKFIRSLIQNNVCFITPGIAPNHTLAKAKNKISEYDFFYALKAGVQSFGHLKKFENLKSLNDNSIWISGTNGKTTTTQMTEFLLKDFGGVAGGNIGVALGDIFSESNFSTSAKIPILETSSFALHYAFFAAPHIYALLPLREDHISWHSSFENYISDKLSVLARMSESSHAIIPQELALHHAVQGYKGHLHLYADSQNLAQDFGIDVQKITFKEPFLLDCLLALSAFALSQGVQDLHSAIEKINDFKIGAHRIEEFLDSFGRLWVDDSKGTNVDASIQAVHRYKDKRIFLILGGDDKGADLTPLFRAMRNLSIKIFAIGSNASKIARLSVEFGIPCDICGELKIAVAKISESKDFAHPTLNSVNSQNYCEQSAKKPLDSEISQSSLLDLKDLDSQSFEALDSVALMSPAAASLDQFSSYKERGELFKKYALDSVN